MTYYIDMDGVLADFFAVENAVKRCFHEAGFFASLAPIVENVNAIRKFIRDGGDVYILSNSPNENADMDKATWLAKYIPELASTRYIFCRGTNKKKFMVTETGTLLDDSEKNCKSWRVGGHIAIQVTSSIGEYLI